MKFGLIGASKTGTAIAYHLWQKGYEPAFLWNRSAKNLTKAKKIVPFFIATTEMQKVNADCDFIIFSVSDDAIAEVVEHFLCLFPDCTAKLFHTSGALDSSIFGNYKNSGSFHPVISISSIEKGIEIIPKTIFTCQGQIAAFLQHLAGKIGQSGVVLSSEQKKVIHVSAVFMNNYLTGMIEEIKLLNQNCGINNAGEILQAITNQTVEQAWEKCIDENLTGPVKRGDVNTIRKHLKILEDNKLFEQLYKNFGKILLKFVNNDSEKHKELNDLLEN